MTQTDMTPTHTTRRITISGLPGSGTTTLANRLSTVLHLPVITTGPVFRRMAKQFGLSLEEFCRHVNQNPTIDRNLDATMLAMVAAADHCIAEGRLTGALVPDATLRVWLYAPEDIRAARVQDRSGETQAEMVTRESDERMRHGKLYHIDPWDESHYDLSINTGRMKEFEVEAVVLWAFNTRAAATRDIVELFGSRYPPTSFNMREGANQDSAQ